MAVNPKDIHDLDPTRAPSVFDIDVLKVAKVYADALLRVAKPAGKMDEYQEGFDSLVGNPYKQDPAQADVGPILTSGMIPKSRRVEVIRKAFAGKADNTFIDFLCVLSDHDRLGLLRPIAAMYRELRDKEHKRVRLQVRSAVPLTDAQKQSLSALARDHFHLEPVLVEVVDPALLGGLQVQFGDRLVDLSVRHRLDAIKQQMIERSSHEIQRRRDRVGSEV